MGVNRIRAGFLAIDPRLAEYVATWWHDDLAGAVRTYTTGAARHPFINVGFEPCP